MEDVQLYHPIKLIVTIVDRGQGVRVSDIFRARHLHFDYVCLGMGTANSEILDTFGLEETRKDVVISLAPRACIPSLLELVAEKLQLAAPGKGIVFTIPLSSASRQIPQVLCKTRYLPEESEVSPMEKTEKFDLIVVILNRGFTDEVMNAAKKAGARGGTVLHARRVGYEDTEHFLGFTIQPEKEIIAILVQRRGKQAIMQAINQAAGLTTPCHGILFSLPVDDLMGLQPFPGQPV